MNKSLIWAFLSGVLLAISLAASSGQQNDIVYAAEYNQPTNLFGTINLLNGNFTKIASVGTAKINDIAYCPTNGILYGISNASVLVTFNTTNGVITKIANLSTNNIQSLAFRPSDGKLFGATQNWLYTINPANGTATSVGAYGNAHNLGSTGQNIRFAQDGNLYVSNTSTNTDIYRLNTTNGAATWMGEAVGYPYLMLMNASSNMYGVFVNLGNGTNTYPELASFVLSSFVAGGTNANGSTHQITINLVGAGTNFPANFVFSGNVPQAVTNLTVPVSATALVNQTVCPGDTAVFSTVASGTPPYSYAWLENGSVLNGQTNSSLTLMNVSASNAATYSVVVSGEMGIVTNSATLTVNPPVTVTTAPSNQTGVVGGSVTFSVTATGTDLSYQWLFNGSVIGTNSSLTLNNLVTSQAGVYTVMVSGDCGSATNSATLTVNKATASITLGSLNQTYNGTPEAATATTTPSGLAVSFTYNGSASAPVNAGSYTVVGTINDPNYQGSATGTLVIAQASASVALGNLNQTYNGSAEPATATTTPSGLAVSFTYNGSASAPVNAGSYTVVGTINNPNYQGSATGMLVIAQASASLTLGNLNQTYNGSAEPATATTTPSGLAVSFTYNGSATVPVNAGSYTVVGTINDPNYQGSATGTLVIAQASASLTLGNLNQTYNGSAEPATATTTPSGLAVTFTYNGSTTAPTNAGSYTVVGTINDPNYQGSATGTLVIAQASASITLGNLSQTYNGSAEPATATTTPSGLAVTFTYNGSTTAPTNAGSYTVVGTINDPNYQGSATGTLVIAQASGSITSGNLSQTYNASPRPVTATTTPSGLTVTFTYNGSTTAPTNAGSYTVVGTINDPNYQGSATNTLVINPAPLTITAAANTKIYDGTTSAAATPTVTGLQGFDTVVNLAETYDTKNVGTGKALTVSSYTVNDGNAGANYTVNAVASSAGEIDPAALTVAANDESKICGQPNPALTASYAGFVSGEGTNTLTSAAVLSTTATTSSAAGTYPITASGTSAANYTVNYVNGTLTVLQAAQLSCAKVNVSGTNQFVVSWLTITNQNYQLEYTTNLAAPTWTPMSSPLPGTGGMMAVTNSMSATPQCFFRLLVQQASQ
jgi:hypothetical protein